MESDSSSSSSSSSQESSSSSTKEDSSMEEMNRRRLSARHSSIRRMSLASARARRASIISNPPQIQAATHAELREFIQEQRKIIASFRSQPWPIQMKMQAIENYKENILKYMPQLSSLDAFREKSSRAVDKERKRLSRITTHLIVWRTIIKKIEGNFGTNVGSYFRLVRWLCMLNLALSFLSFALLILPQLVAGHGLDIPDYIRGNLTPYSYLIDGEGYRLEYSILFYGFYDSGQNESYTAPPRNPQPFIGIGYRLPLAYLFITLATFVISGGAILYSIAKNYKTVQQAKLGGTGRFAFSWRVFASWDYAIVDPKKVKNKMKQHGIGLKEALFDANKEEDFSTRATTRKAITHLITNAIVTILLFGSGYAIFVAADNANQTGANIGNFDLQNLGPETILQFLRSFQLQIVIVLRNFMIPLMFKFIALHEKFHPRTALKLRLLRLFVLYFSSLYVVLISLFVLSRSCAAERQREAICRCWETNVGQEMFKLMLIQTLAEVGSILLVEGAHWFFTRMSKRYCIRVHDLVERLIGNIEFEISVSVLKLVYGQGLIFFGVLFCPFLPMIGFLRNIVVFYLRTVAVFVFDKPPATFFRVASTHNFYMAILFITVFISSLPVGFALAEMTPSLGCGPFRGLDSMFQLIVNEIKTFPPVVQTILNYFQTATIIIPLITLLSIAIYYYAALATALKKVNKDLLLQLRVEQNETRKIIAENLTTHPDDITDSSVDVEETERRVTLAELSRLSLGIVKFPAVMADMRRLSTMPEMDEEIEKKRRWTPPETSKMPVTRSLAGMHSSSSPAKDMDLEGTGMHATRSLGRMHSPTTKEMPPLERPRARPSPREQEPAKVTKPEEEVPPPLTRRARPASRDQERPPPLPRHARPSPEPSREQGEPSPSPSRGPKPPQELEQPSPPTKSVRLPPEPTRDQERSARPSPESSRDREPPTRGVRPPPESSRDREPPTRAPEDRERGMRPPREPPRDREHARPPPEPSRDRESPARSPRPPPRDQEKDAIPPPEQSGMASTRSLAKMHSPSSETRPADKMPVTKSLMRVPPHPPPPPHVKESPLPETSNLLSSGSTTMETTDTESPSSPPMARRRRGREEGRPLREEGRGGGSGEGGPRRNVPPTDSPNGDPSTARRQGYNRRQSTVQSLIPLQRDTEGDTRRQGYGRRHGDTHTPDTSPSSDGSGRPQLSRRRRGPRQTDSQQSDTTSGGQDDSSDGS